MQMLASRSVGVAGAGRPRRQAIAVVDAGPAGPVAALGRSVRAGLKPAPAARRAASPARSSSGGDDDDDHPGAHARDRAAPSRLSRPSRTSQRVLVEADLPVAPRRRPPPGEHRRETPASALPASLRPCHRRPVRSAAVRIKCMWLSFWTNFGGWLRAMAAPSGELLDWSRSACHRAAPPLAFCAFFHSGSASPSYLAALFGQRRQATAPVAADRQRHPALASRGRAGCGSAWFRPWRSGPASSLTDKAAGIGDRPEAPPSGWRRRRHRAGAGRRRC